MTRYLLLLGLILAFEAEVFNDQDIEDQQQCLPIEPWFIMDKYTFDKSFLQLRRFLRDFVEQVLPDETLFHVITVDKEKIKKLDFKKKEINDTWIEEIGAPSTSHGIIRYSAVSDIISNYFVKKEMVEHIYFLFNEKTVIDIEEKFIERIIYQNVQTVLFVNHTKMPCISGNLKKLSGNIHLLSDNARKIKTTVQSVMKGSFFGRYTSEISEQINNPPFHNKLPIFNTFMSLLSTLLIVFILYLLRDKVTLELRQWKNQCWQISMDKRNDNKDLAERENLHRNSPQPEEIDFATHSGTGSNPNIPEPDLFRPS